MRLQQPISVLFFLPLANETSSHFSFRNQGQTNTRKIEIPHNYGPSNKTNTYLLDLLAEKHKQRRINRAHCIKIEGAYSGKIGQ